MIAGKISFLNEMKWNHFHKGYGNESMTHMNQQLNIVKVVVYENKKKDLLYFKVAQHKRKKNLWVTGWQLSVSIPKIPLCKASLMYIKPSVIILLVKPGRGVMPYRSALLWLVKICSDQWNWIKNLVTLEYCNMYVILTQLFVYLF